MIVRRPARAVGQVGFVTLEKHRSGGGEGMKVRGVVSLLLCSSGLALAAPALAQESGTSDAEDVLAQAEKEEPGSSEDIVVTGTLLRGIAPVGSATVGLSNQAIEASGVT